MSASDWLSNFSMSPSSCVCGWRRRCGQRWCFCRRRWGCRRQVCALPPSSPLEIAVALYKGQIQTITQRTNSNKRDLQRSKEPEWPVRGARLPRVSTRFPHLIARKERDRNVKRSRLTQKRTATGAELPRVITRFPHLITMSLAKTLRPNLAFLRGLGFAAHELASVVADLPHVLVYSVVRRPCLWDCSGHILFIGIHTLCLTG
jgi:hypothetical protein